MRTAVALLVCSLVLTPALAAQGRRPAQRPQPATPTALPTATTALEQARYRVRVLPGEDLYDVRAEFTFRTPQDTVLLSLPAWTTGSYGIENYARFVRRVRAEAGGSAARWDKADKDTWRIVAGGQRSIALEFRTNPDSFDLSQSAITADFAFFNGTNLLVYPEGAGHGFAAELTVEVPDGWRQATGLSQLAAGRYRADSYHDLVDAPFFLGRFAMDSVRADERWLRFAIYPESALTPAVWDSVSDAMQRLAIAQNRIFGGPPYETYTVLFYAPFQQMEWGGGLEHHNSQFDAIAGPFFAPDRRAGRLGDFTRPLLSHEFFHLFNVKRIRPAEMWPYDYSREQFTPLLWWSEGVTDYYGDVTMVRAGLWTVDRFVQSMSGNIAQVEDAAEIVAVEDASINTWIKPTFVEEAQYYYPKGSLLGLLLDIQIRAATDNRQSLDDVMRALYDRHWRQGRGFTTDDLLGTIRPSFAGVDDFYRRYVDGREPLPYAEVLPRGGIAVDVRETKVPLAGVAAGAAMQGGLEVLQVTPGSLAAEVGLLPGDVLLRLGDVATTNPQTFGVTFRSRYRSAEGQPIEVAWRRGGQEMTQRGTVQMRVTRSYRLSRDQNATPQARAVLTGMLEAR